MTEEKYITVRDYANLKSTTTQNVYTLIKRGKVASIKQYGITLVDLEKSKRTHKERRKTKI